MAVDLTPADLGQPTTSTMTLHADHVAKLAATLDVTDVPQEGAVLPPLWHWAFFTPTAPTGSLGLDGHPSLTSPRLSGFPRRMWGAGRVEWQRPLVVGVPATRTTAVVEAKERSGASGSLLIVELEHTYRQQRQVAVVECQSIVYRDAPPTSPMEAPEMPGDAPVPGAPAGGWTEPLATSETLLFRFSALTFNAHRIHYDRAYARDVEGYLDLVVHGPLTALRLAGAVSARSSSPLASFEFRATAPMFVGRSAVAVGDPMVGDAGEARVHRNDGTVAMTAAFTVGAP